MIVLSPDEFNLMQNVTRMMEERGLSLRKLGELCDLPHTTLQNFLEGRSSPRVATLCKLANALGVPPAELLSPAPKKARTAQVRVG